MSEVKKATRDGFGEEIVELGKRDNKIYVVDVDIGKSCKTGQFRAELPEQYFNVGIAEQNAAGVAAGMATCGKTPFVVTYAVFGSLRMCEMIRQEICYPNLNVKIACSHGGVTPANDGASHQCIEDLGVLRTLPNMTVIMPAYVTSELKHAFIIGFLLYIPFLLIDIIVSSTLMSMGMVMLPPSMISTPFKILLFILLDGWQLLFSTLVGMIR